MHRKDSWIRKGGKQVDGAASRIPNRRRAVIASNAPELRRWVAVSNTSDSDIQGYTQAMSETAEQLLKKALSLGESDRASLAGALIESLDSGSDPDAKEAWDAEIERRVKELETGSVKTIPWSEVRQRLFRGFD